MTLEDAIKAVEDEPTYQAVPWQVRVMTKADPDAGINATITMVKQNIIERLRQRHGTG